MAKLDSATAAAIVRDVSGAGSRRRLVDPDPQNGHTWSVGASGFFAITCLLGTRAGRRASPTP